ncbi:KLKB1 [Trypoxylus dichotomus]
MLWSSFLGSIPLLLVYFTPSSKCAKELTEFLLKYPYQSMVRLREPDVEENTTIISLWNSSQPPLCTGLIVNSVYILTHARCSEYPHYEGQALSVALVTSEVYRGDNSSRQIVRWIKHESYKQLPDVYDLALIELERYIYYDHFVHPAVMFYGNTHILETQLECSVLTWNDSLLTLETTVYFMLLTKVDVQLMSNTACNKLFPKYRSCLCVKPVEPPDLCGMDLGTPLTCGIMNIWVFLGIYIGVNTCPDKEPVFLFRKMDEMRDWLERLSNGAYLIDGRRLNAVTRSSTVSIQSIQIQYLLSIPLVYLLLYRLYSNS